MAVAVRSAFCADVSSESAEPLAATASHIEHWLLVEYRGMWDRDVLGKSLLSEELKQHLREQLRRLPRSRLLFIRQPQRRRQPRWALYFGSSAEQEPRFFRLEFDRHEDVLALDFADALLDGGRLPGVPLDHPVFVVCAHGKRDRCCAKYGRPLYDDLRRAANPGWVWQSTHVGGDRFAGNVVCLPEGLYYGRVEPEDVEPLLESHLRGEVYLERYRGRSCYRFPAQAAERTIRAEAGVAAVDDLRLLASERTREGTWRVRFLAAPDERVHEVEVAREVSEEAVYLTCNAVAPRHVGHFVTTAHRVLDRP